MGPIGYANGMKGKLIAAARALLGWSQQELATRAGVSRQTLVSLERDSGNPTRSSETAVVNVLLAEGIEFEETPTRISAALVKRRSSDA